MISLAYIVGQILINSQVHESFAIKGFCKWEVDPTENCVLENNFISKSIKS
jgi:hypothetical protein